jgi:hypothetical protein
MILSSISDRWELPIYRHLPGRKYFRSFKLTHHSVAKLGRRLSERVFSTSKRFGMFHIPIIHGNPTVDPIRFIVDMPAATLTGLANDSRSRDELDAHWIECAKCVSASRSIDVGSPCFPFASQLLKASEAHLRTAVLSLLTNPPNSKAAEQSRMSFECALKGLAAGKGGMLESEGIAIRHDLKKLVKRCAPLIDLKEQQRLDAARKLYPKTAARYKDLTLSRSLLWKCYFEARHALTLAFSTVGLI